ncbi:hypothetical protein H6A02_01830 [Veillonella magna]|uniref:CD1375 family protein n=1 Tax=Veillonella magna TaxID=464322 RepID=UPI00195FC413|nr:CD1375 family protein [Veillonella magna]MBM6823726.1 hypothetical protein [Veillonella magna]
MILDFMIPIYGRMVLAGEMTVDEENTKKRQVPKQYVNSVIRWLIDEEEARLKDSPSDV